MPPLHPTRETAGVIDSALASLQPIVKSVVDRAVAAITLTVEKGSETTGTQVSRHVETCMRRIHAALQPKHSIPLAEAPPKTNESTYSAQKISSTDDETDNATDDEPDTDETDDKASTASPSEIDLGDNFYDDDEDATQPQEIAEEENGENEDDDDEDEITASTNHHLKPFDPHDDSDHHIAELRVSITRHGNQDQNRVSEFSSAMEEMVLRFKWAAKVLPNAKHTITRITNFLEAAIFLMQSGSSFFNTMEEVDLANIEKACRVIRLCGQKQEKLEQLIQQHTEIEASNDTIDCMQEAHSLHGAWNIDYEIPWSQMDEIDYGVSWLQMDESERGRRVELMNINRTMYNGAINMITSYSLFDAVEEIIADHPDEDKDEKEKLKEWYVIAARQASRKLNPRTKRNGPEVLHSPPADIEEFLKALEQGELPTNLWRQQKECIEALAHGLRSGHRDIFFEMPPGTGKTIITAILAHLLGQSGNILYLAPSGTICEQDRLAYEQIAGHKDTGIIAGRTAVLDQKATFSTYTSAAKYVGLNMFPHDKYCVIVFDEAHRSLSEKRQAIRKHFSNAIIIACSASGTDIGGKNLSDEFTPAYKIDFLDGVRAGIVNPIRLKRIGIPTYTSTDMSRAILQECREQGVGRNGEQAIVMMARLAKVRDINEFLYEKGMKSRMIEGTMPPGMARDIEKRFRRGETSVLNLCRSLYEGWDHPKLSRLFIGNRECRKDWELRQRVGRIVRVVPGKGDSTVFELVEQDLLDKAAQAAARGEHFEISGLDTLFALDQNLNFRNGDRVAEPIDGFWPEHAKISLTKKP